MKHKVAVKAFIKVMAPVWEAQAEAESLDAGFDGGEFSGPAHARYLESIEEKVATKIAARFGMSSEELLDAVSVAAHVQAEREFMHIVH